MTPTKMSFGNGNKNEMSIYKKIIDSPLGDLIACATEQGICMLEFSDTQKLDRELAQISKALNQEIIWGEHPHFILLEEQLKEYFSGERRDFSIPIFPIGTQFQKEVWSVLQDIPYGQTISYQQEALLLKKPKAVRAVANANGQNKISILIPCHRVIGSNGTLTGYGGGLWRKQKLLEIEKVVLF